MPAIAATSATAYVSGPKGACNVVSGVHSSDGNAWAVFNDTIMQTGWATLELHAPVRSPMNGLPTDTARSSRQGGIPVSPETLTAARAAGCVEGHLTQGRIYQQLMNAKANLFPSGLPALAVLFLDAQVGWLRSEVASHVNTTSGVTTVDPFWAGIAHELARFDGLVAGYAAAAPAGQNVSAIDLYAMSSATDLNTLQKLENASAPTSTNGRRAARGAHAHHQAASRRAVALVLARMREAGRSELFRGFDDLPAGLRESVAGAVEAASAVVDAGDSPDAAVAAAERHTGTATHAPAGSDHHPLPVPTRLEETDCSALVRVLTDATTGAVTDVLTSHATWADFYLMLRVYKHLHLGYGGATGQGQLLSMSSYPGLLSSSDDWYVMANSSLVVSETTNAVFNVTQLEQHLSPFSALSWQRAMAANLHAGGPQEWIAMFATANSGTCNDQWIIVDAAKAAALVGTVPSRTSSPTAAAPAAPAATDVLWLAEQMPGGVHSADMTATLLRQGWWASYNIPYFSDVYDAMGYPAMAARYGAAYTWDKCPRARIFARNASGVTTTAQLQELMRYNDFRHDPLSKGDPMAAISSRGDLSATAPAPFGAYDAKWVSAPAVGAGKLAVSAISGPSTGGSPRGPLPVFSWAEPAMANVSHAGQPTRWDFDWVVLEPTGRALGEL